MTDNAILLTALIAAAVFLTVLINRDSLADWLQGVSYRMLRYAKRMRAEAEEDLSKLPDAKFCECGHTKDSHGIIGAHCQGPDSTSDHRRRCSCMSYMRARDGSKG